MMREGWASLDALGDEPTPDPNQPTDQEVIDRLHVAVFNNPAGMRLLAYWRERYLEAPVCVPGAGAEVGFHREGQNQFIRELRQRINRGLTPKT